MVITTTALNVDSSSLFGNVTLNDLTAVQTQALTRASNEITAKQDDASKRLEEKQVVLSAESDRLVNVKSSIMNAQFAYEQASESMDTVISTLLDMRSQIVNSETDYTYSREQFDSMYASINSTVDGYSREYNPIGNVDRSSWLPNTIEYKTNAMGDMAYTQGTYAGADFKITMADGSVWRPDSGTSIMEKFGADGTKDTTYTVAMTNAVQLAAYDEATGSITIEVTVNAGQAPEVFTGTLERGGLGVMPSWFYRSQSSIDAGLPALSSEEDRQMAFDDLNNASINADVAKATVGAGAAKINSAIGKVDTLISENTVAQRDAMVDNLTELTDIQNEVQRQYQVMANNLSRASAVQQQYANIFASTAARNPFFDSLT